MMRLVKFVTAVASAVALVPVALFFWGMYPATSANAGTPSEIVDFSPTPFSARADANFFYVIERELKYSDRIDPDAPTLLRGSFGSFLVSPDAKLIAVVADDTLQIVSGDGSTKREVVPVRSIYSKPKPIGMPFYWDNDFQWSRDSKSLYLIKDEYNESKYSPLWSPTSELWRYELDSGTLKPVLKPFSSYRYFLGSNQGIYFSTLNSAKKYQLKYFDGSGTRNIDQPDAKDISADQIPDSRDSIFFSFSFLDYARAELPSKGVRLNVNGEGQQELVIGSKTVLLFTRGINVKGTPYYGSEMLMSAFLPGDRYLYLYVRTGAYKGSLLIDSFTGSYMTLPKYTRVYPSSNTTTFHDYRITSSGIEPIQKVRY